MEIDLDALRSNLATVRARAGAGIAVHPVVKADAYGHGALPIARTLEAAGADGLCVAVFDEAVALRNGGIHAPIVVLSSVPAAFASEAARRRIGVTVGEPALLDELLSALAALPGRRRLGVQIEVETGLGRGGLQVDAVASAAARIVSARGARLDGLWTHFQAPEDAAATARQLERFEAAAAAIRSAGIPMPRRHAAASGAIVGDGVAAYEGVRPGLSIYGLVPDEQLGTLHAGVLATFRPLLSIHARPVRVATLPAGWGISYGPTFRTTRTSSIATLPLGYGDGWPRSLSNRAEALVRGRRVPLVGNVAMDAVMADVSDVPGAPITVDDEFVLLGRQGNDEITAADLARARTTNSWEVVTNLSWRLPRVYHAGSGPGGLRTLTSGGLG
ncbi:MAG: Alanine racemase [Chloroflexi bacterium]|nr:Alanine racemase [Chloroflexota bacterium]